MFKYLASIVTAAAAAILLLAVGPVGASTPPASSDTVPTAAGQTVTDTWTGTIPPGANAASDCSPPSLSLADEHDITISVTPGTYDTIDATFTFSITWTPSSVGGLTTSDEILTVIGPDGEEVGSSDGGSNVETVVGTNLAPGLYKVLACGFANANVQPYDGKLEIKTTARSVEPSLPSAPAQGLAFTAAVAADNQRDEAEPLMEIDKSGNIYTCGPTGFSNAADYAQVSTDGGDQFHMLGSPPRGQQGAGGGGDCSLATGLKKNSQGNFQYAYAGLGPLTGFATSTSPNNGHNLASSAFGAGETDEGGLADRQWETFLDDQTVLISYNQQEPRNTVVQKSTDGGLTFSPDAAVAARNTRFPGPMHYNEPLKTVYFAWDRGGSDGDHINLSISKDGGTTWTDCLAAVAPANANGFVTVDNDSAGNIYLVYGEQATFHTYMVTLTAGKVAGCDQSVTATTQLPTKNPGFSQPVQVDRDAVRSTVFPWVVAGGAPGYAAVMFYGSVSDGNPNSGSFKGAWDVYVNQSVNALSTAALSPPTFSQVKATTHPFHYDSICLNGLACDLSVPAGDRTLADFAAIDYNPVTKKLSVVFNRDNKQPDESLGHVANPMVATQTGGPSNGGGLLTASSTPVVRTASSDPPGDALSSYSILAPAPPPLTTNEPAADFLSVSVGPEIDLVDATPITPGGFTVTMKVADLSTTSLLNTLARTQSQSVLWLFRFTNGYQDAGAAARWAPGIGFTFGFNDYTTGSTPCVTTGPVTTEKCVVYPGDTPIQGDVDQATGTIRLSVPRYLLRALGPNDANQRPTEVPATDGTRFYDATAFSLGNTVSPMQDAQSFLYTLDNAPSMDFLLGAGGGGGGGGGGGLGGCKVTGGGSITGSSSGEAKFTVSAHQGTPPKGNVGYKDSSGNVDFHSTAIASLACSDSMHAQIAGAGINNNGDPVGFTIEIVDNGEAGTNDTFKITLTNGYSNGPKRLTKGNIQLHS